VGIRPAAGEQGAAQTRDEHGTLIGRCFEWSTLVIAALIVAAALVDMLRLPVVVPTVGLAAALLLAPLISLAVISRRRQNVPAGRRDLLAEALLLSVIGVTAWQALAPAWPSLLPVGNSPDAVHHTALANYIFEQRQLVRDPRAVDDVLIEMADYPPGFAVLAAMTAQATTLLPVQVIYPLAALTTIASVLGCALLIVASVPRSVRPIAGIGALAAVLVPEYIVGAIASENYYPQMLAQWLLVAIGYVLTCRQHLARWLRLALLLLALLVVYTTWLPVALLAITLSLLIRRAPWLQRFRQVAVLVVPVALLALAYSWSRTSTGNSVLLHEGSTIRDPLGAMGVILPIVAALGLVTAWYAPRRRSVLWLILAAVVQIAGLWLLWQRGQIAGYIYYKGSYLLSLLLGVPIGWLLADGVGLLLGRWLPLRRHWTMAQPLALAAVVAGALMLPVLPSTAQAAAHPLSPALLETARWIRDHGAANDIRYALRKPGLPAYWLHVGVLGQPRTAAAHSLLTEPPLNVLEWYFHPAASRMLLLEQPAPPEPNLGLAVRFQNQCCVVLEKTDAYSAALQSLHPLLVSYTASWSEGMQRVDLELFDALDQPDLQVRLMLQGVDQQVLTAYAIQVPRRAGRVQYLGFAFDPHALAATGYANDAPALEWPPTANGAPVPYRVVLQLLKQDMVVQEQLVATCCADTERREPAITQPHGVWAYFRSSSANVAPTRDHTLGEAIGLIDAQIESQTIQPDRTLNIRLWWQARQTVTQRYTTFVQLIAADGGAAVSMEGEPNTGAAPTWRWQAGEVIADTWQLKLPADLQPGTYQVVVGMYDPATGQRLEAWQRGPAVERFWTNALPLGTVEVQP
jgi:hypothetical protein